jgi:hypothetical protein
MDGTLPSVPPFKAATPKEKPRKRPGELILDAMRLHVQDRLETGEPVVSWFERLSFC